MPRTIFKFKKEIGWSELIAFLAVCIASWSGYMQYNSNDSNISLNHDKIISTAFIDKDGKKKYFGLIRATLINKGNKAVTLLGLKPNKDLGIVSVMEGNNTTFSNDLIGFKIFQIPDSLLSETLLSNKKIIPTLKDDGLEKLSIMNKVIGPGEVYILYIGTVFDVFSNPEKRYSSVLFSSELEFSNDQKLTFGAADVALSNYW